MATNGGISEELTAFTVKPNPASDVLFVENTAGTSSNVSVYSITGALVMTERFENEVRLDVASLPRGMYIVRMENGLEKSSLIQIEQCCMFPKDLPMVFAP